MPGPAGPYTGQDPLHRSKEGSRCASAWTGPFGDRSNVISFISGPTTPGAPPPPPCTAELRDAYAAILPFAEAVLARPETSIIQGSACYPSR